MFVEDCRYMGDLQSGGWFEDMQIYCTTAAELGEVEVGAEVEVYQYIVEKTLQFDEIRDLDEQYEGGTNIEEELNIKDVWKLFIFCLFS